MIWNAVIFGYVCDWHLLVTDPSLPLSSSLACSPHETPFEDGTFKLTLEFTEEYPNKPPTVRFVSKMFHPNGESPSLPLVSISCQLISSWCKTCRVSRVSLPLTLSFSPSLLLRHASTVYADGSICLDILQNRWSPTYDVSAILTSIQSLLDEPNPNSPANSLAAQLYQENRREYEKRVVTIVEQSWLNFNEEDEKESKKSAAATASTAAAATDPQT